MGWRRRAGYWIHPVLRLDRPGAGYRLAADHLLRLPDERQRQCFRDRARQRLPVAAVLTWSGIASVNRDYYDIARTLGASERFLILKVAVPAAPPHLSSACSWGSAPPSPCWSWPRCWA